MGPQTRYARAPDGVSIADQVIGDGPRDLVWIPGWVSHVEAAWDEPTLARFFEHPASFTRLILFDKRGTGMSDRVPERELPTLEMRMSDVLSVCDAVGSARAALLGTLSKECRTCGRSMPSIRPHVPIPSNFPAGGLTRRAALR